MAIRFLRYEGDPILRQVSLPVRQVDSSIQKILQDMADTLYNTPNGAGLSANQVGILKRLIVVNTGAGLLPWLMQFCPSRSLPGLNTLILQEWLHL